MSFNYKIKITEDDAWNLDGFLTNYILSDLKKSLIKPNIKISEEVIKTSIFAFEFQNEPQIEDYDFEIDIKTFNCDNEDENERYNNDILKYKTNKENSLKVYGEEYLPYSENYDLKAFLSRGIDVYLKMKRWGVNNKILEILEKEGKIPAPQNYTHSEESLNIASKEFDKILEKIRDGLISRDFDVHKEACILFAEYFENFWD